MDTPILDFLKGYQLEGMARLHMPGHKGRGPLGVEGLDLTEIKGADSLWRRSPRRSRAGPSSPGTQAGRRHCRRQTLPAPEAR